jgi:dolichol kinase
VQGTVVMTAASGAVRRRAGQTKADGAGARLSQQPHLGKSVAGSIVAAAATVAAALIAVIAAAAGKAATVAAGLIGAATVVEGTASDVVRRRAGQTKADGAGARLYQQPHLGKSVAGSIAAAAVVTVVRLGLIGEVCAATIPCDCPFSATLFFAKIACVL